jgi:hypothetical protein
VLKPEGNLDAALKQFQTFNLDQLQLTPFERNLLEDVREHLSIAACVPGASRNLLGILGYDRRTRSQFRTILDRKRRSCYCELAELSLYERNEVLAVCQGLNFWRCEYDDLASFC